MDDVFVVIVGGVAFVSIIGAATVLYVIDRIKRRGTRHDREP